MADVLPGFSYSRGAARYRDLNNGRFVSHARITELLEQRVNDAENRLAAIVQGVFNKEIAPGVAQEMARDELRRLNLSNAALGKGGIEQLNFRDYGRTGRQLRDSYQRMSNLLNDVQAGRVSLTQALNRVEGYTIEARNQFFAARRDAQRESGRQFEERRTLHARESCRGCISYAAMGWQPHGTLPLPGSGDTQCGRYCRCTLESREVVQEAERERVFV